MSRRDSLKRGKFLKDSGKPFLPIAVALSPAYLLRTGFLRISSKHLNFGFPLSGLDHLQEASSGAGADKFLSWPVIRVEEKVGFLLDPHEVSGNGLSPSQSAKCCNHSSSP